MIQKLVSINTAFLLRCQLAPDWLRVMSNRTIASRQKSQTEKNIQLERDSDDKNNHIFTEKPPSAFLDTILEMT